MPIVAHRALLAKPPYPLFRLIILPRRQISQSLDAPHSHSGHRELVSFAEELSRARPSQFHHPRQSHSYASRSSAKARLQRRKLLQVIIAWLQPTMLEPVICNPSFTESIWSDACHKSGKRLLALLSILGFQGQLTDTVEQKLRIEVSGLSDYIYKPSGGR